MQLVHAIIPNGFILLGSGVAIIGAAVLVICGLRDIDKFILVGFAGMMLGILLIFTGGIIDDTHTLFPNVFVLTGYIIAVLGIIVIAVYERLAMAGFIGMMIGFLLMTGGGWVEKHAAHAAASISGSPAIARE